MTTENDERLQNRQVDDERSHQTEEANRYLVAPLTADTRWQRTGFARLPFGRGKSSIGSHPCSVLLTRAAIFVHHPLIIPDPGDLSTTHEDFYANDVGAVNRIRKRRSMVSVSDDEVVPGSTRTVRLVRRLYEHRRLHHPMIRSQIGSFPLESNAND